MRERNRVQLVVSLGEGETAEGYRRAFEEKAAEMGLKVTVWARRTLLRAASVVGHDDMQPSRREFEDLERRVAQLEAALRSEDADDRVWKHRSHCGSLHGDTCDCGAG